MVLGLWLIWQNGGALGSVTLLAMSLYTVLLMDMHATG